MPPDALRYPAAVHGALSPQAVSEQVALIQRVMQDVMSEGEHFGVLPGCGPKPMLLKAGAEKLSLLFRLAPRYTITRHDLENGHREYEVVCELLHIPTGQFAGEGVGLCSTMETKYRYRKASRICPACGEEAIIKGKAAYGGGWVCFKKKGGCGAKYDDGDEAIEKQPEGRVENTDIADTYNTVLKMAKKRAHIDAILTATAASDLFTQDLEDLPHRSGRSRDSDAATAESKAASASPPPPDPGRVERAGFPAKRAAPARSAMTAEQRTQIAALARSSCWSTEERRSYLVWLERPRTREAAEQVLDHMREQIAIRRTAAAPEETGAVNQPAFGSSRSAR